MKTLVALILLACAATAFGQSDSRAKEQIRKVMDEQAAAWNRGDIREFMKGYWQSDDLVFVSGTNVTRGWQPTLDRYLKSYDSREKMGTLSFTGLEINVLSKESAYVLGNWSLKRANDEPGGKFTLIFRKLKEGWRIVHDHTS